MGTASRELQCEQWKVSGADDRYLICSLAAVVVETANFLVDVAASLRCLPALEEGTMVAVWQEEQVTWGGLTTFGLAEWHT